MRRAYRSTRKYRCPYCSKTMTRDKLGVHIEKHHEEMIPEGYTGARTAYDYINKKNYSTCMICGEKVYEWDPTVCRYKNLCGKPECLAAIKRRAANNHLEDPEVQKKLLAGRRISGTYTFSDGVTHSYVGSYEKNCFEFMDTVLNIPGKDIMSPGPTIWYEYNGEKHPWILDWMYIPAMLCADVKDGGNNPNNRPMEDYRAKQIAKEETIAKTKYNYIRLTDNNFGQLLSALADIRMGAVNHDPDNHIFINEAVGGMVGMKPGHDYIIPRLMNGLTFVDDESIEGSRCYFGNTSWNGLISFSSEKMEPVLELRSVRDIELAPYKKYILKSNKLPGMLHDIPKYNEQSLLEELLGIPYDGPYSFLSEAVMKIEDCMNSDFVQGLAMNGYIKQCRTVLSEATSPLPMHDLHVKVEGSVTVRCDEQGYYCETYLKDTYLVSDHYQAESEIPHTLIETMNLLHDQMKGGK